ncbi:hypothetical protein, partial [Mesorhizobium sp. LSJC264A00]|uniref:hypothetical protein n=1 Tax=Mesorhizobium sp. LSJC264A00 TaxID=1287321 RepID=UPI0005181ABD
TRPSESDQLLQGPSMCGEMSAYKEYEAPPIDEASPELMNHDSFEQWSFAGDILAFPLRTMSSKEAMADPEISRFPYKERPCMPGS